jgi:hypothetical protein
VSLKFLLGALPAAFGISHNGVKLVNQRQEVRRSGEQLRLVQRDLKVHPQAIPDFKALRMLRLLAKSLPIAVPFLKPNPSGFSGHFIDGFIGDKKRHNPLPFPTQPGVAQAVQYRIHFRLLGRLRGQPL